jgi:hypothetical protein
MEFQFDSEVADHEGMKVNRPSRLPITQEKRWSLESPLGSSILAGGAKFGFEAHKDERSPLKRQAVSSILTGPTIVLTDRLTGMAAGC